MNLPSLLFALRASIADTRAQARAAGLTIGFATVTAICVLFCVGVSIEGETPVLETRPWEAAELIPKSEADRIRMDPESVRANGVDVPNGELKLLFGLVRMPLQRQSRHTVRLIETILAGGIADTVGVLFALLWTSSFLPGFLEPASASVLLAKPSARWSLLAGKAIGIVTVVVLQSCLFVTLTWLALGFRTGTWDLHYFLAVPVMFVHFMVFLSISTLLAVITRSAVGCALGTFLAWALAFGINVARHEIVLKSDSLQRPSPALEMAYWIAPKPLDYNLVLADSLQAGDVLGPVLDSRKLVERGQFSPDLSLGTGFAFGLIVFSLAGWRLSRVDY